MNNESPDFTSKLPQAGQSIFSHMSAMANERRAINLSQGFPDYSGPQELTEYVLESMKEDHNQYAPMPGLPALRQSIKRLIKDASGVEADEETEISVCGGATQGINVAISAFVSEGDEVIVFEPAYDSYVPSVLLNGGKPVYYTLEGPDFAIDWQKVVRLISNRTKMIILNTPHNPVARVLKKEDIRQLEKIMENRDIIVLSDEVYEHMVFTEEGHISPLSSETIRKKALGFSSFGKTYHNTGWKMGYTWGAATLIKEFRKVFQYMQFSVNTPLQHAFARYIPQGDLHLRLPSFYREKRDLFLEGLSDSRFNPLPCEGSYFLCATYEAISDKGDMEFTEWLCKEKGIATIPLSPFYRLKNDYKIIRFCFAKEKETLLKAIDTLCRI